MEPAVQVEGVLETRRAFRKATGSTRELSRAWRTVAKIVEEESRRRAATRGTRQQAAAAKSMLGSGTGRAAILNLRNTKAVPFGLGAYLGGHRRQFPDWVGNNWDLLKGKGPYVVAPTIKQHQDEILGAINAELSRVLKEAGIDHEIGK